MTTTRKRQSPGIARAARENGKKGGRPKTLTEADYGRVLDALRDGQSLLKACQGESTPNPATVLQRVVNERQGFGETYAQARHIGLLVQEEQLLQLADEAGLGEEDPKLANAAVQRARLQVDTRKWVMSKMRPERYGDRVAIAGDSSGSPIRLSNDDAAREVAMLLATAAARKVMAEREQAAREIAANGLTLELDDERS